MGLSWVAWLFVTVLTVGFLSVALSRRTNQAIPAQVPGGVHLSAVLDLLPMFMAASGIRALLGSGVALHGSFAEQLVLGSAFGATVNNLPAAAAVQANSQAGTWAAILAMSIGPNLLLTGSVATLICRRIARDSGATLSASRFLALGAMLVPLQLAVAFLGLQFTGALR